MDSSVAIKWFVAEPYSAEARRILDDYQTGAISFLAPDLIFAEIGNILWKKQVFQGFAPADAVTILAAFRRLTIQLVSTAELLEEAYHLAVTHRRSVYDSLYLALSVRERCPIVTADEKLVNSLSASFPGLIWVANW